MYNFRIKPEISKKSIVRHLIWYDRIGNKITKSMNLLGGKMNTKMT